MINFSHRVALVTGAGRGLGFAYAKALAERGATVFVQDSGTGADGEGADHAIAETAAARIVAAGGRAVAASGAIASRLDCAALVDGVLAGHGRLDVLIHNAGWVGYQAIEALEPDFLDRMVRLSIDTPLWLAQAAWPAMRNERFGRILLTTSDRAIYPEYAQEGLAAYAAAKMATIGIVNTLALEGRPHGITVNAISPVAKTRMRGVEDEPDELRPDAVMPGALYLVSPGCETNGWVMRAANGQFVATRAQEAAGVSYPRDLAAPPATTPEDVAAAWHRIAVSAPEARTPVTSGVSVAYDGMAVLGESPLWSERRGRLLWVDTEGRTLNQLDPATGRNKALGMPDVVGMVAERADGTLVAALGCDLATIGDDGEICCFATAPDGQEGFRLNDGRFDDEGRLWIGLMHNTLRPGTGILYRYDPDGTWHVMANGFALVNGLDWSPDRQTLYVTDSRVPAIYAYAFDAATGTIGERRPFVTFGPEDGFPDGLLVGPDGAVWSTLFDAGAIQRIEPDGCSTRRIELPVSRPTSCAFSPDGTTLYVTTARLGLSGAALTREPTAGAVLQVGGAM
jgi:sugar lactone lactonase YvrE/NAD(P)-dependent dehydrogenase (short-subunit alcohol dehydrogenase family)